ncbi:hypothetical protein G5C51_16355 [Streptomyces sp. A7024]|uniref:Uncharacterized protein n=1 Tax=Streptomyces coryli TaxID=1128680 RepID=A0A6G4U0E1_9ACTN|nr:DUF6223 family protein [Streptomyces coryli]NGN65462.1 hypothetical protein [Streptomyces coryli]
MSFGYELAASVDGMTADRFAALVAWLVGLAGIFAAALTLAHAAGRIRRGPGRSGGLMAVGGGLFSIVLGAVVVATADGGPGTGNGLVGAVLAVAFGLVSTVLGRRALARTGSLADA